MPVVYLLLIFSVGGAFQQEELPVPGGAYVCARSAPIIAAAWLAQHEPTAKVVRMECREGHPA
jgi:hypothetical protein